MFRGPGRIPHQSSQTLHTSRDSSVVPYYIAQDFQMKVSYAEH